MDSDPNERLTAKKISLTIKSCLNDINSENLDSQNDIKKQFFTSLQNYLNTIYTSKPINIEVIQ
ncbi:hypothetical protein C2G38_2092253 [Gigaspora rosea]|uniref:Uncharacterized protein n=1 Tax=Gigaspora rosea TaxID=44941 RepID=A0A397V0I4_9GLOM|nr:hypothetical protein C2G38_2092253 [Gigaspora rosea]